MAKEEKKGKRKRKNMPTSEKWKKYKIEGDKIIKDRFCPRCGPGIFLAKTKDRMYCGKCHLTEFIGKPQAAPAPLTKPVAKSKK
jgi:small subunit ribosomal protein S27Ae